MHPILAQQRRLALYLFVFLQAGLLLGELLAQTAGAPRPQAMLVAVPLLLLHSFSCLASWYLCRSLPLRTARPERLVVAQLAAALLAGGLLTAIGLGWSSLLERTARFPGTLGFYRESSTLVFAFAVLTFTLAVAVHYLFIAYEASRAAESRAFELKILAREAELKALKAQIDPHFLFNSLNSISGLVTAEPEQARRMCAALAGFLRQSLRVGDLERHPLAAELALAESYLAVEQVRFGERLRVDLALDPAARTCEVPPLILQPLVENAVRHGIAGLLEGGTVRIAARAAGRKLHVEVENPRDPDLAGSGRAEGIGLTNVRRRLAAEVGREGTLAVEAEPGRFRVTVALPIRHAAANSAPQVDDDDAAARRPSLAPALPGSPRPA